MSALVVDVSVGVKWMLPEPYAAEAVRLQSSGRPLHVPDFFEVELANVLWRKVRQGLLTRAQADAFLLQVPALPLVWHADRPLLPAAFDLADQTQRTVYDCLYLVLAVQLGCQLVTADERFVNSLASTPWAGVVVHIRDLP
jgi:predicted nucleic acid-binding protein